MNTIQTVSPRRRIPLAVALLAGAAVALMAAYLLVVGVRVTIDTISGESSIERVSDFTALIPLVASALYLRGVAIGRRVWAVAGAIATLVYGVLFLFGVGPYYAPAGLVMLIAALWATGAPPNHPDRPRHQNSGEDL